MAFVHSGAALAAGLGLGTTYLLSIGPNTMMIIREGLVRGRVVLVSSLVLASYVALLLLSYGMTDAITAWSSSLTTLLTCVGIAAMVWFAMLSIRASIGGGTRRVEAPDTGETLRSCLRRVLVVTALNPLLYVEFLLIPSGALGTYKDPPLRFEFTAGLIVMAALTCYGYAAGGRAFAGLFRRRRAMQAFDFACGCLLMILAVTIGAGLFHPIAA